jgi:photosystem II stability/assembly factor-like uncharacterized protein
MPISSPLFRFALFASAAALLACLVLPASASATGTWSIQNPTTVTLAGAACPEATTCWAVGATGTIVVTDDSGATWTTQSSGTRNNLNGVACATTTQCLVVGNKAGAGTNGVVLATTDGGSSWATHNSGTANNLTAVACADESTCWAVGQNGTILKTTTAGATWSPQTSGTTTQLNGISCPSTTTCFAVGNKDGKGTDAEILATTDGGASWIEQAAVTTNNLNEVACVSGSVCRAVGQSGTILATADAGATWTVQASGTTQALSGVTCASVTSCHAVGAAGTIVATNDGSTWSAQASGKTVALNAVACVDAGTCRSVGATGTIIATTDGGSNWVSETSGTNAALRGVSCISTTSCWAVGNNGVILATATGGTSWLRQTSGVTKQLNGVHCLGFGTCYAVGATNGAGTNALIVKTVNGGATWTVQNSNTTNQLFGVACTSATACWAVGQNGAIVATTNGTTWAPQASGVTKQLNDVACPAATTCVAAGATNGAGTNGIVVKTTDGTSWSQQNSNTNVNLNGVACADQNTCWVAAQSGRIAATTDGGTTWSAQTSGVTANLNDVACGNVSACWAVGNNTGGGTPATIVATTNGGSTWSPQTSNTTNQLESVTFVGTAYGWAVGNAGTIGAYIDDSSPPDAPELTSAPFSPGSVTTPSWSFSGEDGATFECRLDRGSDVIADWSPCTGDASYDLAGEADGAYTFAVRATDAAGNTGPQAESDYTLDTTAPVAPAITAAPDALISSRTPSWSFTGEPGVAFECRLDRGGTQVFAWGSCTSAKSYALIAQPDGAYTFAVRATDAAGNPGPAATDDFTLDTVAPAAPNITASPASPDDSQMVLWSFTGEGGASVECRLDRGGTEIAPWVPCGPGATYDLSGEPDGVYTFSVRATDAAGNVGAAATSGYTLDTDPPAAPTLTSAPASPAPDLTPSWAFTGELGATFECSLDASGGGGPSWSPCASPKSYDLSGEPDGSYTFSVRAIDAAGNVGPTETSDFTLDASAPEAPTIDSAPPVADDDPNPSWSFSAPSAASYECRLAPGADPTWGWQPCTSAKSYDLSAAADGTYTFSVRAKDIADNTSAPTSRAYTFDTAAPNTPTFASEPASPGHDEHPAWSFSAEAGATFECELRRGATLVTQWACGETTTADLSAEADGTLTLAVRARDAAGNLSVEATSEYALDTDAPVTGITSAPPGPSPSRLPSWSFDAEPGAAYSCRLDRGGTVIIGWGSCTSPRAFDLDGQPDGQYTFSVRATDTAANTGDMTTSDYVLDTAGPGAPQVTSAPASPGRSRSPSWSFSAEPGTTLECRLDQGATTISGWATCSGSAGYDLSGRPDASYTFSARAIDAAGNDGPITTRSYALDTTAPGPPTLLTEPAPAGAGTAPSWSFNGEAGATFECRLDRGTTPFSGWTACNGSAGYDLTGEPDGTFTFSVRAVDPLGNVGVARTDDYELLTSAPASPSFIGEPPAVGNAKEPAWAFANPSGTTAECRVERGSTVVADWAACVSPFSYDLSGQPDGGYELAVRAVNTVGIRSLPTRSPYLLDTHAPDVPVVASSPGTVGANPTPTWSFAAEPGTTLECRLERGTDLVADWSGCNSPHAVSLIGRPDGTYEVAVRARDAAGNTSEPARSAYRLLTSVPGSPRLTLAPAPIGRTRALTWAFAGEADDGFECRLQRGDFVVSDWQSCTSPRAYDIEGGADGGYEFSVRARNVAGTLGAPAVGTYLLDTMAPDRPSLASSPRPVSNDVTPTWGFTGEAGGSTECRLRERRGDAPWAPCASPRSFKLAGHDDGHYVFEARTTDAAGNVSPTLSDGYVFDTTPPRQPKLAGTPGAEGSDRSPTWSFTSELDASFECQLKYADARAADWASCTSPRRYALPADDTGTYSFSVRATDPAGNTGQATNSSYRLVASPAAPGGGAGGGSPTPPAPQADEEPETEGDAQQPASAAAAPRGSSPADDDERSRGVGAGGRRDNTGERGAAPPKDPRASASGRRSPAAPSDETEGGVLGKTLDSARRAVERAATAVADNADKSIFPLSLVVIVACFLLIQGRIDRNDPKLALAPSLADTQMEFGPPARVARLHDRAGRADRGQAPSYERGTP